MRIEEFDTMAATQAAELLRRCVRIESWVEELVQRRPFGSAQELLLCARMHAATWTDEEVEKALADEPRIGEDDHRYEERFGRRYLVRGEGRTQEELSALLEERLENDPDTERSVTKEQLTEIALLRLEEALT